MDSGADRVNFLSKRIIGCALTVLHALGTGFLEKVYETHWCTSYASLGSPSRNNIPWPFAKAIDEIHLAQCLNYLKATGLHLCLQLNFGKPRLEIKRIVLVL